MPMIARLVGRDDVEPIDPEAIPKLLQDSDVGTNITIALTALLVYDTRSLFLRLMTRVEPH